MRRWRPIWGYVTAGPNALLAGAAGLLGALAVQWSVALAVLGVNVAKRSEDKATQAGQTPAPGILGAIVNGIAAGGP